MLRTELIRPLPELLRAHADRFGDKPAFRDGRREVGYAELEARTRRLAGHLAGIRLQPGDRAAIYLPNCVEAVESYLAITRAGAIGVPLNPRSTDTELAYLLDDSGATVVITDPSRVGQLQRLLGDRGRIRVVVTGDGALGPGLLCYEAFARTEPAAPARDDLGLDEIAWMLYTSGTTGKPKGVLSTQRNGLWSAAACYVPVPGLSADDRVLWPLPLHHSLSHIACVLSVTAVGATARILDDFGADEVLRALRSEAATLLTGVPTMYHYLVSAARQHGFRAPGLRMCLVGGAVTSAELRDSFEELFGVPLLDAYGSTETCGSITINWPTGGRVAGSCGLPVPGLGVRLVDPETGIDVAADAEGEVWVRGPCVMVGYHNQPEATAEVLRDGWYRTGDLARRDEAGYFTVTGRIKELIIRGGENIHPGEVEDVLRAVPGVLDAAVVGKAHDVFGEVPVAFLVPGRGGVDPDRVFAACRESLSAFKVPEELYEIGRIPRTASGKITRHVLLRTPARLRAAGGRHYESLFRVDWIPLPSVRVPEPTATRWTVLGEAPVPVADALRSAGLTVGDADPEIAVLVHTTPDARTDVVDAVAELSARIEEWLLASGSDGCRLVVLTHRAVAAGGAAEVPVAVRAACAGLVRSRQAAHPGRIVLVDVDDNPVSLAALPSAVSSGEPELAVRSGILLLPRLARVAAEGDPPAGPDPRRTVLVTGADRPEGAAAARQLVAAHGVRHLLLTSPGGNDDRAATELAAELARSGAKVALAACDPADRSALAGVLGTLRRGLTAVVHTETGRSLRATVDAMRNLHELTEQLDLAAFVLYTSAAGWLGGTGHPEQAAAGALADALVRQRRAAGKAGLALAWGPLEAGNGTEPAVEGIGTLPGRDAMAMFDAAQAVSHPVLLALRLDVRALTSAAVPPPLRNLIDTPAAGPDGRDGPAEPAHHPVLGTMIEVGGSDQVLFTGRLPAGAVPDAAVAGALRHAGSRLNLPALADLTISARIESPDVELQILVSAGTGRARVFSRSPGDRRWMEYATARLTAAC